METKDYRAFLAAELRSRNMSGKELAAKIGLSPSFLSQILKGRRNLSTRRAEEIATVLEWPKRKREHFCLLIHLNASKDERFRSKLSSLLPGMEVGEREVGRDMFHAISQWYHAAILELTELRKFRGDPRWIAERLKIPAMQAELAVARLLRLGLLEKRGNLLRKAAGFFRVPDQPSEAIRRFHKQMLEMGAKAYDQQEYDQHDFTGTTFAVRRDALKSIKQDIADFHQSITRKYYTGDSADAVYHVNVQLFRLDSGDT